MKKSDIKLLKLINNATGKKMKTNDLIFKEIDSMDFLKLITTLDKKGYKFNLKNINKEINVGEFIKIIN